jgi:sugar phosphate isomerase/epimerase
MMTRRSLLRTIGGSALAAAPASPPPFTDFQIACMTWPYRLFLFRRAIEGIAAAGYRYVAWGPTHQDSSGKDVQVIAPNEPAKRSRDLAALCTERGLTPVMMFAVTYVTAPEALDDFKRRIEQAAAAKIPFILAFGSPKAGPELRAVWIRNLQTLGPLARASGVTIVIKQHGGVSATGRACGDIVREVNDGGIRMFYDSGNTLWYADTDAIGDLKSCAQWVRGFAIKDFRAGPPRSTCGPGFGEVDHFKLLLPVGRTGLSMPLACENVFEPGVPRPGTAEGVDALARRAREFLETTTRAVKASLSLPA